MRFKIILYVKDEIHPLIAYSDDFETADIICDSVKNYYGLGNSDVWFLDYGKDVY